MPCPSTLASSGAGNVCGQGTGNSVSGTGTAPGGPKRGRCSSTPQKAGQRGSSCTFTPSLAFGISLLPLELCASADFSWGTKASPVGSSSPKQEIYGPFHGSGPPTEEISTLWMRSAGNAAGIIKDTCRWEKPFSHRSKPNFC